MQLSHLGGGTWPPYFTPGVEQLLNNYPKNADKITVGGIMIQPYNSSYTIAAPLYTSSHKPQATSASGNNAVSGTSQSGKNSGVGGKECSTCENRKYKDQSDDPSVSFQAATHISPENAAAAVRSHEQEHVRNNAREAESKGMEASSTVTTTMSMCPECGRGYVSGGKTTTVYTSKRPIAGNEDTKGNFVDLKV